MVLGLKDWNMKPQMGPEEIPELFVISYTAQRWSLE